MPLMDEKIIVQFMVGPGPEFLRRLNAHEYWQATRGIALIAREAHRCGSELNIDAGLSYRRPDIMTGN
jgi:hypothetical protein